MASSTGSILVAVDGESHTDEAVRWAVNLALGLGSRLNPVHVRDPYLKQFYTEIYAQGREEYLQHVQDCLEEKARKTEVEFETELRRRFESSKRPVEELTRSFDVLDGEPARQLHEFIGRGEFSMIVLGRRRRTRAAVLRSRDLAERLSSIGCSIPMFVVPELEG